MTSSNADLYRLTLPLHREVLEVIEHQEEDAAERAMTALLTKTMCDIDERTKPNLSEKDGSFPSRRKPHRSR